jgi:PAS domain S-box-containing protein
MVVRKADTAILTQLLIFVALPLVYLISGWLGLLLAIPPGYATAIFVPAGIAVTATFLAGAITLAPIFLGSFLLNIWIGYAITDQLGYVGFASALSIAIASTLQAAIGGTVLRRFIGYPALLDAPQDLIFFLALSPVVCLTSATISIASLWTLGVVQSPGLVSNWLSWWAGDTLGLLVTFPLMLVLLGEPQSLWHYRRRFVAIPMLLSFGFFVIIFVSFQSWAVLAAGGLGTGLLGAFLLLGTGHAFRFEKLANKLRRSESELNTIISSTPFMLTRCSRDLRYRFVSLAYAEMLGRRPEDLVGLPIVDVMGNDGFNAILPHVRKVLEGNRVEYESEVQFAGVGTRFLKVAYVPERDDAGHVEGWIASVLDISEHKRAEETEKILVREIQHRSNNLLAVVQGIAHRSLTGSGSLDEARAAFEARLQALARANNQLIKSNMTGLTLGEVVRSELEPFAARMIVDGDEVKLGPQLVQSFALILHELATNASKYGALSCANGTIEISWSVIDADEGQILKFKWHERDGPVVTPPLRNGFGTSLLKTTFPEALLDYASKGLICKIDTPLN